MPDQAQFPGQYPDEKVIFLLRRHWFILMMWLVPPVILFLVTVGVGVGIGLALPLTTPIWVGVILLLSIGPLGLAVWRFLDWENDHYILTDRRILHIERVYFLFESREEAGLNRIQDVTIQMPSLAANLLYFGDVEIETAGTAGQIQFKSVAKPRKVQRLIFKQAGLPEPGTRESEEWQPDRIRILRPLEAFTRMLYAVVPQDGRVVVWRKHWFVLFTKMMRPLLAALLLLVVWIAIISSSVPAPLQFAPERVIKVMPGILLLILAGWMAWITIDWHNDLYILTDKHVIDIEKRPFTLEFRREANLGMIQNVSYEQPSFVAKLLGFGNTRLETAGTMGEFTFDSIANPHEVQEEITRRLDQFRQRSQLNRPEPAPRTREELEAMLREILGDEYDIAPRRPGSQS
ncbi:MAG: hypothetical protein MAG451_01634 [Anaerolineales bacterium]|nr:hypothetical protein [Anaerolineales bacterium]